MTFSNVLDRTRTTQTVLLNLIIETAITNVH